MDQSPNSGTVSRRMFVGASLGLGSAMLLGAPGKALAAGDAPLGKTENGNLLGYTSKGVNVFKGVPYGESTAGEQRFKRSVKLANWTEPKAAQAVGDPCYQINQNWKGWIDDRNGSEDCLFLNVWAPAGAERKPVMVFFHGGGYRFGSGGAPLYDGTNLAAQGDVVVVTVNHRLHALGFAFFGDIAPDAGFVANAGLLDLVDALQWVKANIANFGGDPDNVTILGQSGGGGKVSCLMAMPSAKGLFHRAIVQSGAQRHLRSREDATKDTIALMKQLGLDVKDPAKLLDVPVEQIYEAFQKIFADRGVALSLLAPFSPVIDGEILPWHPDDERALEISAQVPKMIGTNSHESLYFLDFAGLLTEPASDQDIIRDAQAYLSPALGPNDQGTLDQLLQDYKIRFSGEPLARLKVRLLSDLWMGADGLKKSIAMSSGNPDSNTYHYVFTWEEPYKADFWSVHGAEILFVFDNVEADEMWGESGAPAARAKQDPEGNRYMLRDNIVAAWTSFARTGKPKLKDNSAWPAFEPERLNTMVLGEKCEVKADYFGKAIRDSFDKIDTGFGA